MRRRAEEVAAGDPPDELLVFDPDDWPPAPPDRSLDDLPDRQDSHRRQSQRVAWLDAQLAWQRENGAGWLPGDPAGMAWVRDGEMPTDRAGRLARGRRLWAQFGPDGPDFTTAPVKLEVLAGA